MSTARYGSGGVTGRRIVDDREAVEKRYRDYNPEHRRQRRIGMAEAAAVGGGGAALGFGVKGTAKDTKKLRALEIANPGRSGITTVGASHAGRGAIALSRRNGALVLGGGAALAGAGALRRWAESNRGRAQS